MSVFSLAVSRPQKFPAKMFAFGIAAMLAATSLMGQSFQGGVRGTVSDSAGAVVANVKVTLTDAGTKATRSTLTNPEGQYVFNAVNPATYTIVAENPGFKKLERANVIISTQEFLTVDLQLQLGAVSESVMVTEEVPLLETSNASTGQVIDRQKLVDLPNLGRNPFLLSKLAQNVVPVGNPSYNRMQDQSGSSAITIAGGPVRGNNYLLDGVPITDSTNRAIIIPTLESVEEVKVQANTYDAEMGRTGGGVFNTYMKSGTNAVHMVGFGYMRQTEWLANNFFANRQGLPRQNQPFRNYGGSVGGPIFIPKVYNGKNRTFFFVGAEAYRQTSIQSADFALPTLAERAGDFSQSLTKAGTLQTIYDPLSTKADGSRTPFAGNIIPANRLDKVGINIARTLPVPQRTAKYFGDTNYTASGSLYDRADQLTAKGDHQVTSWWRASLSYLHYGSREPGAAYFPTVSSPEQWLLYRKVDSTQFNNILTPNPTTVISIRYGYNRFPNEGSQRSAGLDLIGLGFPASYAASVQKPQFPNITFQTLMNGDFPSLGTNNAFYQSYNSKNFLVSVSKFMGRHSLKAGFDYRRINIDGVDYGNSAGQFSFDNTFTRANAGTNSTSGADLASLLLGYPTGSTNQAIISSKLFEFVNYYAGYVHDDFRVTSKLTLNLGVRYEWETGLQERKNQLIVGFDRNTINPIPVTSGSIVPRGAVMYAGQNGYPTSTGNPNKNKISPRFGVAYQLDSKTTIRGGYGIFWAPIPYGLFSTLGYTQTTPYVSSSDGGLTPAGTLSNPFPNGVLPIVGNSAGKLAGVGGSVTAIDQNARSPIVHQYSIDIQRQIPFNIVVGAGYVGSLSRHLVLGMADLNINQLEPQYFSQGASLLDTVTNPFYVPGGNGFVGRTTTTRQQLLRPFPQYDRVTLQLSDQNKARYDSFVLKAQKRYSVGLTFVSTWTYSRNMDASVGGVANFLNGNGAIQNVYDLAAEYSRSIQDTPHRWANGFTYELPVGKGKSYLANNKFLDLAVGGWSVNAINVIQTGFPLAIKQNSNNNSVYGTLGQRPNATGTDPGTSGELTSRLDGYLNPAAFSEAPRGTFGNVSRTISTRGPGMANWDLSLFKTFSVFESFKAQFRAEAINAFNTPLFRGPNTNFGSSSFGKITSQANYPRYIQLGVRLFF